MRSHRWFGVNDLRSFGHRSRTLQMGYDREDFAGKPVIAVVNTWSEINPCHTHLRDRAESVKRGVWQAGGFPLEVPAISLSEPFRSRRRCSIAICWRWRPRSCCGLIRLTAPCCWAAATRRRRRWSWARSRRGCRSSSSRPARCCGPPGAARRSGAGSDVWKYWDELRAGHDHRGGLVLRRGADRLVARSLHDDGHGVDDDLRGRGAGFVVAGRGVDPCRRQRSPADGGRVGPPHRLLACVTALAGVVRERDQGRAWRWAAPPTRSST